ncbi:hypothetical protein VTO73DRAFT_4132 [Trametes versicolor]
MTSSALRRCGTGWYMYVLPTAFGYRIDFCIARELYSATTPCAAALVLCYPEYPRCLPSRTVLRSNSSARFHSTPPRRRATVGWVQTRCKYHCAYPFRCALFDDMQGHNLWVHTGTRYPIARRIYKPRASMSDELYTRVRAEGRHVEVATDAGVDTG